MAVPPTPSGPGILPGHPGKPALRVELRARRTAFVEALGETGVRAGAEAAAALALAALPADGVIALYLAFADEIDPAPLAAALAARGQRLALPFLADRTDMVFRSWAPGDPLARGPFRLRQPLTGAAAAVPDHIIAPLLGFDRKGGRIGQGASHYDRAFARFPGARRIGFAWSVQETPLLPHDPWDMPLDAVITERERMVPA